MQQEMKNTSLGLELLSIAFIVLKLCKVIDWSWWWVLSPIWILFLLAVVTIPIIVLVDVRKRKIESQRFKERMDQYKVNHDRLSKEQENEKDNINI